MSLPPDRIAESFSIQGLWSRVRHGSIIKASTLPFLIILTLFVLAAAFPNLFSNHQPDQINLLHRLEPPLFHSNGSVYLLGTDELGRDVYSRMIYGARVSLMVSAAAVLISGTIGGAFGVLAGYYQKTIGSLIMRFADIVLSVPFLLLAILTVAVLGPNLINLILVLSMTRWPRYTRVAYGQTLSVVNQDFVKSSKSLGATPSRLIATHIFPEVIPSLIVVATLEVGLMIMFEAALSFLGLGVQPPNPSWGSMLTEGQQYIYSAWWLATFPGLAIFLVVLSVNLLGDHVRDRLDPKNTNRR